MYSAFQNKNSKKGIWLTFETGLKIMEKTFLIQQFSVNLCPIINKLKLALQPKLYPEKKGLEVHEGQDELWIFSVRKNRAERVMKLG